MRQTFLAFLTVLPLLAAPASPRATPARPRPPKSAASDDPEAYLREARVFLERLHLREDFQTSIQKGWAKEGLDQNDPFVTCLVHRMSAESLETLLEPRLRKHLSLADLRELNPFLGTSLGVAFSSNFRGITPPKAQFLLSPREARLLEKPSFQHLRNFSQDVNTLPASPEWRAYLMALRKACLQDLASRTFTPPPIPSHASAEEREAAYIQETLRLLERCHWVDIFRNGFLRTRANRSVTPEQQQQDQCIAAQLTPKAFEPLLRPCIRKCIPYERMVELNAFFQTPLGSKLCGQYANSPEGVPSESAFTPQEKLQLNALNTLPCMQAWSAFNAEDTRAALASPAGKALVQDMLVRCRASAK